MPTTVFRLLSASAPETSDAELLGRFTSRRDEAAFTELVRRHGSSVWRVCRRLAGPSSADDAFQATFLILACRAESVRKAASVGSWLIGVAGHVARQMLRSKKKLDAGEDIAFDELPSNAAPSPIASVLATELSAILDDELTRLPDHLRDPIVLCLLQGQSQEQAAAELGGSVRTIRRRLDRAKTVLRLRLERRGVVPAVAAGMIAAVAAPTMATSPELTQRTVRGVFDFLSGGAPTPAVILAKGIVMGTVKLKVGGLVAAVAAVVFGLGLGLAGDPPPDRPATEPLVPLVANKTPPQVPASETTDRAINERATVATIPVVFKSRNFIVSAPSETQARLIATEAEYQRREVAKRWLGRELPNWSKPCEIKFTHADKAAGGATTFTFTPSDRPVKGSHSEMLTAEMQLTGSFLGVVEAELPHEVTHCVMATHFGKPLPRWADEGVALLSKPAAQRAGQEARVCEILNAGRAIRLKHLFKMYEYPRDMIVLYAQGYSVVRFLDSRGPSPEGRALLKVEGKPLGTMDALTPRFGLMMFIQLGMNGDWDKAAKDVYGFESVDALETAWIDWLKKAENKSGETPSPTPSGPKEKPELIPQTKLPGVSDVKPKGAGDEPAWTGVGRLVPSPLALDGRLTYALESAPGIARLYVVAGPGFKMEEYKNRTVKLLGMTMNHPNASKPYIVATEAVEEKPGLSEPRGVPQLPRIPQIEK